VTHTPRDVANWMLEELTRTQYLYQETAVWDIASRFGSQFVYDNVAGNMAIGREVLAEFRKLTATTVVWDRGERVWRFRQPHDTPGRRQTE
jgi:hypothetical protein